MVTLPPVGLTIKTSVKKIKGKRILLPSTWRKFSEELMDDYSKKTLRAIRKYAPKGQTGYFKSNIKIDKGGKLIKTISFGGVPWVEALEKGWKGHWIPRYWVDQYTKFPGNARFKQLSKAEIANTGGWFYSNSVNYKHKGFIKKGFLAGQKNFQGTVDKSFNKTIKR